MKAIEPTEILTERDGTIRDKLSVPVPWIRFWARVFDYALFCSALWVVRVSTGVNLGLSEMLVPSEYLFWAPVEALFLLTLGTTPGKWLLNTEIQQGRRSRLEPVVALKRSFLVWLKGIGLGIPVLNVVCLLLSYQQLMVRKVCSWDISDHIHVTHRPLSQRRVWIVAALASLGLIFYEVYGRHV